MHKHKCFVPGCEVHNVPAHQELCDVHWKMVPLPLRKTLVLLRDRDGHDEALANAVHQVVERIHWLDK